MVVKRFDREADRKVKDVTARSAGLVAYRVYFGSFLVDVEGIVDAIQTNKVDTMIIAGDIAEDYHVSLETLRTIESQSGKGTEIQLTIPLKSGNEV